MNIRLIVTSILAIIWTSLLISCTAQELPKLPYSKSFLVDVRTPQEFAEGSATGAVNIPLQELEKRMKEFDAKDQIVVFCKSGNRSSQAKAILEKNGYKDIINGGSWGNVINRLKSEANEGK